jgi:putative adenylate-forming enzyme
MSAPQVQPQDSFDARVRALAARMLERERWPRERLLEFQQARLREMVQHAVTASPYYREVIGDRASHVRLQTLPILTKATLMEQFDRIVTDRRLRLSDAEEHLAGERAREPLLGEYRIVGSGGTTGQRGIVAYDQPGWETALAGVLRATAIQGIPANARVIGIGAPTPLHMTNRLFADLHAGRGGAPRVAVTTALPEVNDALNGYQPQAVITYPSFIRRLAEEQHAGRLRIAPQTFCSVAEALTQDVRDVARETWGAVVLNSYGATEAGIIGQECPRTAGMHVYEDLLCVEVVDADNQPVAAGVAGHKVLITNLFNRALPLIRYELSDLVTIADGSCPCGRTHLRLASVRGRREDVLSLPARDGGRVNVHAFLLGETLLHRPAIRQYQLSPRQDGLLVRLVLREETRSADALAWARQALEAELDKAGARVSELAIERVDRIARTGGGAKQKVVSLS